MPKPTRDIPDEPLTLLDQVALERARERHANEEQMKKLREWFIYEAPPGVYQKFLEEREALIQEHNQRMANHKWFLFFVMAIALLLAGGTIYDAWESVTTP